MNVRRITQLPDLSRLTGEGREEGFRFVDRLIAGFTSGDNRFDQPGEALFAVFKEGVCVGIGGVNRDPGGKAGVGRVRRVYISPAERGMGTGRLLMAQIEAWCQGRFASLELFTDTKAAAAFYERLGYQRVSGDAASHRKVLG